MNWCNFFEEQFPLINTIIHKVASRKVILDDDAADFTSYVYEKLINNNYSKFRQYRGGTSNNQWRGYLTLIISNLALDYQKIHWHRFHHSKVAMTLGEPVKRFEIFLYRDFLPSHSAFRNMLEDSQCSPLHCLSPEILESISSGLPESLLKKLQTFAGKTIYFKQKWRNLLENLLIESAEQPFFERLNSSTRFNLTQSVLEGWYQLLPNKTPPPVLVHSGDILNTEYENSRDSFESILPSGETDPLQQMINKELTKQLENKINKYIQDLSNDDWLVLSLYLEKKNTLMGIARMLGYFQDEPSNDHEANRSVTAKAWEKVKGIVMKFESNLKIIFSTLQLDIEDREIIQEAFSLTLKILSNLEK